MKSKILGLLRVASAAFFVVCAPAHAQQPGTVTSHAFAVGKGSSTQGFTSILCTSAQIALGQSGADPICRTLSGDVTINSSGVMAIGANKVTLGMQATLAADSFIGNPTASTATPSTYTFPNCAGALIYSTTTHIIGCNNTAGTGTVTTSGTPAAGQFAVFTNSTTIQGVNLAILPQGRPTLTSGSPVMKASVTAASQIFYDCYAGNQVPVFNGTQDVLLAIASCEISDTMPTTGTGVTNASGVFDFWIVNVSGTSTLCHATNGSGGGWASDTGGTNQARGTGYSQLDFSTRPQVTNKNSITHCYHGSTDLGPISANQATAVTSAYTTAAGQTVMIFSPGATAGGNNSFLGLYSFYNQVRYCSSSYDNRSGGWTSSTSTWEALDLGGTGSGLNNRVSWIDGLGQSIVNAEASVVAQSTSTGGAEVYIGVIFDATSGQPTGLMGSMAGPSAATNTLITASDQLTAIGLHFAQAMEQSSGGTYFGIVNGNQLQRTRACLSM